MMHYCTLFNTYYLSRGLALYHSLLACAEQFHLTIFAMDDKTYALLIKLNLEHATVIPPAQFETPALLAVKKERTIGEYCWTCTSATILHCLEKLQYSEVCYLDADLYFFQDPAVLLKEAEKYSILITLHRYTPKYDHAALSGKYCVQFMYFKNDAHGIEALTWWRDACLDWCYDRVEEGKFGDQKYLDDWTQRFQNVKVLEHLGGGVAPWNVQQYEVDSASPSPVLIERSTAKKFELVFYHFHALKFINHHIDLGGYQLSPAVKQAIYQPYIAQLLKEEKAFPSTLNIQGKTQRLYSFKDYLRILRRKWMGVYNVWHIL